MSVHTVGSESVAERLAALRGELDRVDDALHDALMRRAELVAQVGALRAKGPTPMRPGREAAIIRRLLGRTRGALDGALVVRMWRELISGFTVQQQAVRVAVAEEGLLGLAVAHFGGLTGLEVAGGAVAALAAGRVQAALVRWPGEWWVGLMGAPDVHVVARLPFFGTADGAEGFVLTQAEPDPSGEDRTLIAAPLTGSGLQSALMQAGFGSGTLLGEAHGRAAVAELDGFVAAEDERVRSIAGARRLGAYAVPLGDRR